LSPWIGRESHRDAGTEARGPISLAISALAGTLTSSGTIAIYVRIVRLEAIPTMATARVSGHGRESGLQQTEEYLNVKAVWIKTA